MVVSLPAAILKQDWADILFTENSKNSDKTRVKGFLINR